jgi:hypothetical protein
MNNIKKLLLALISVGFIASTLAIFMANCGSNHYLLCIIYNPSNAIIYDKWIENKTCDSKNCYIAYLDTYLNQNYTNECIVKIKKSNKYENALNSLNDYSINSSIQVIKYHKNKCDLFVNNNFILHRARIIFIISVMILFILLIIKIFVMIAERLELARYSRYSRLFNNVE